MIALAVLLPAFDLPLLPALLLFAILWYGAETLFAAIAGWHVSARYPLTCLARDLLLPVLFVSALHGDHFVWRGSAMQVERLRPRGMMARVRPRLNELAPVARQRLRSLRERMS